MFCGLYGHSPPALAFSPVGWGLCPVTYILVGIAWGTERATTSYRPLNSRLAYIDDNPTHWNDSIHLDSKMMEDRKGLLAASSSSYPEENKI